MAVELTARIRQRVKMKTAEQHLHVAVIGAGVIGTSVAVGLAERGFRVELIDQGVPGSGTSSSSYGWVNANNKEPQSYYELNLAGMAAHHLLAVGAGGGWLRRTGHVELATDPQHAEELDRRIERLDDLGYAVKRIGRRQARELVPDLTIPPGDSVLGFFPDEAHLFPNLYLAHLLQRSETLGVQLRLGLAITGIDEDGNGARLRLSDDSTLAVDRLVSATGSWTNRLLDLAGLPPLMLEHTAPGDVTVGFLAVTAPLPTSIDRLVTGSELNVRPEGGGRLLLQALELDASADPREVPGTESALAAEFTARLRRLVRRTDHARLVELKVGQRAMPVDGRSIIGFVPSRPWLYLVATHSGITLAPLLGERVAAEIGGHQEPLFADFRPERLLRSGPVGYLSAPRRPGQQ